MNPIKIMVVAGGSGGHVFPALAFCQEISALRREAVRITFVTTAGLSIPDFIPPAFNPVSLKIKRSPGGFLKLIGRSVSLMRRVRPDLVFGFGGYVSVPLVMLAKFSGKKAFIHEQNAVPGRANRFLSGFADKIAVTFPQTEDYLKADRKKIFLSRYPLRDSLKPVEKRAALEFFGFQAGLFTVLVLGGSRGSRHINENFLEALKSNKNLNRLQVIHLSGHADFQRTKEAAGALSLKSKVFAFLFEMNYAYSAADLVIGRSGAGSVHEIMRFGLPSVLIPYPHAGAHQKENARVLAQRGASILLEDDKLTPEVLNGLLDIFIDDPMRRKTMASLATALYDSSKNLKLSDLVDL